MNKKTNKNFKGGKFTKKELTLYSLSTKEIDSILNYQKLLPILQQDDTSMIDARDLHKYLKIGKKFASWITERIKEYGFEEDEDYFPKSGSKKSGRGGHNKIDYDLTLDMAKELAMSQSNELGRLTRRYFLAIEKAFKHRQEWNRDRVGTIEMCKELKGALLKYQLKLHSAPDWYQNFYVAEFSMLNNVIIGMSAKEYRATKGVKKSTPIRNTFTEQQLEWVDELEKYDADLINVQDIYDYEKRQQILTKKFDQLNKKSS